MTELFAAVLNRSITTSVVIAAVFLLRLLLKKAPGYFAYLLWLVAFARLLCPVSLEADWGVIPGVEFSRAWEKSEPAFAAGEKDGAEKDKSDTSIIENDKSEILAGGNTGNIWSFLTGDDARSTQSFLTENNAGKTRPALLAGKLIWQLAAGIWLTVCAALLLHSIVSYWRFMKGLGGYKGLGGHRDLSEHSNFDEHKDFGKHNNLGGHKSLVRCKNRSKSKTNVEQFPVIISENIKTPFVAGFFKPAIYLPKGLEEAQLDMVREHEKIHIARRDYLIKPAAYLAVCIYWFNPLVWLAFYYMEKDMEISCDEAVLKRVGYENNKVYAKALLSLSQEYGWRPGCPIAFGENGVKDRIKNIVKCKRAKGWIVAAGIAVVLAATVLLFVNSKWNLVISLEEQTAENTKAEKNMADARKVPETDGNTEVNHIYYEENSDSENQILPEEKIYLPEETITHSESISANTDHYYYPSEINGQQGKVAEDKTTDGKETENKTAESQPETGEVSDDYQVLLRQAEGIHEENELKFAYPLEYTRISDDYGVRIHPVTQVKRIHSGIDFAADKGTPVRAAATGLVLETGNDIACGNYVIVQHSNGDMTYYANCDEILAKEGQSVAQGEQIATVGSTGRSTGAHLHYAVSRNGEYMKPEFAVSANP
ncbi:MAG: M23/M56 family metallopeptidase [Clostridium sp.]|nr:M23/M56 family metallopeptidase [Clostridium sp.]